MHVGNRRRLAVAMDYRSPARIAADEYCSVIELNRCFGSPGNELIARCFGLDDRDVKWVAPDGRDMTALCDRSALGGFDSTAWTLNGWVLSDRSMAMLRAEFPEEFANR